MAGFNGADKAPHSSSDLLQKPFNLAHLSVLDFRVTASISVLDTLLSTPASSGRLEPAGCCSLVYDAKLVVDVLDDLVLFVFWNV